MPAEISFGKFQFDLSPAATARPRDAEEPFRLLIVADLGGRSSRGMMSPVQGRNPILIDTDNFDREMKRLESAVRLSGPDWPGTVLEMPLTSVEDFHPDPILRRPPLKEWCDVRQRLLNPSTGPGAIDDVNRMLGRSTGAGGSTDAGQDTGTSGAETTSETLARLMGSGAGSGGSAQPGSPGSVSSSVDALIRNIVSSSSVPARTSEQSVCLQAVEAELSRRLGLILHDRQWQAIEANWRGVDLLVRDFGGEENFKIFILDVSRNELEADLCSQSDLASTGLFRGLRDSSWGAIVAAYFFSDTLVDLELIGRLAKIGEALGAPVLSAVHERFLGCPSVASHPDPDDWKNPLPGDLQEVWNALRRRPETRHIGLALPRVLLRLPYGKGHDEIDSFPFEELDVTRAHESYLWGNPAFACAHVIAQAFQAEGWDLSMSGSGELGELPVHRYTEAGASCVKPCAEAWLSDRAADRITDAGFIPVQSIKGRDAIRVANLRALSVADGTFAR
jgi:type VI secretion system protein ImpC